MAKIHATARRCDNGSQIFWKQLDIRKFGCLLQKHFQRGLCLCPILILCATTILCLIFLFSFSFRANSTVESLEALCRHFWPPVPYMNEAFSLSSFQLPALAFFFQMLWTLCSCLHLSHVRSHIQIACKSSSFPYFFVGRQCQLQCNLWYGNVDFNSCYFQVTEGTNILLILPHICLCIYDPRIKGLLVSRPTSSVGPFTQLHGTRT